MSDRARDIIRALRAKTVERGCTVGEAAAAEAKAEELCVKYGLPKGWGKDAPHQQSSRKAWPFDEQPAYGGYRTASEMEEAIRRAWAEAAARAKREGAAKEQAKAKAKAEAPKREKPAGDKHFASVKDCAEHFLNKGWKNKATGRPLTNEEVAALVREHMGSNTTAASVAWYRSKMKKEGRL